MPKRRAFKLLRRIDDHGSWWNKTACLQNRSLELDRLQHALPIPPLSFVYALGKPLFCPFSLDLPVLLQRLRVMFKEVHHSIHRKDDARMIEVAQPQGCGRPIPLRNEKTTLKCHNTFRNQSDIGRRDETSFTNNKRNLTCHPRSCMRPAAGCTPTSTKIRLATGQSTAKKSFRSPKFIKNHTLLNRKSFPTEWSN